MGVKFGRMPRDRVDESGVAVVEHDSDTTSVSSQMTVVVLECQSDALVEQCVSAQVQKHLCIQKHLCKLQ